MLRHRGCGITLTEASADEQLILDAVAESGGARFLALHEDACSRRNSFGGALRSERMEILNL